MAHASRNERKSDPLPAALHLNAWVEHNQVFEQEKSRADASGAWGTLQSP